MLFFAAWSAMITSLPVVKCLRKEPLDHCLPVAAKAAEVIAGFVTIGTALLVQESKSDRGSNP